MSTSRLQEAVVTFTCLKCSASREAKWVHGRLELARCQCGSYEFRLSGGARGVIAQSCASITDTGAKVLEQNQQAIWDSLVEADRLLRPERAGGGPPIEEFCIMCENQSHFPPNKPWTCDCACHAIHALVARLSPALTEPAADEGEETPKAPREAKPPAEGATELAQISEIPDLPGEV